MKPTLDFAIDAACKCHGLTRHEIFAHKNGMLWRTRRYVRAREQIVYLARKMTGASYPELAACIGYGCHTTILDAVRRAGSYCETDPKYAAEVDEIERTIMGRLSADAVTAESSTH